MGMIPVLCTRIDGIAGVISRLLYGAMDEQGVPRGVEYRGAFVPVDLIPRYNDADDRAELVLRCDTTAEELGIWTGYAFRVLWSISFDPAGDGYTRACVFIHTDVPEALNVLHGVWKVLRRYDPNVIQLPAGLGAPRSTLGPACPDLSGYRMSNKDRDWVRMLWEGVPSLEIGRKHGVSARRVNNRLSVMRTDPTIGPEIVPTRDVLRAMRANR